MENLDDEEIQRLIEEQLKVPRLNNALERDEDAALYHILFAELEKPLLQNTKGELADKVVQKIELKRDKAERSKFAVLIFIILLLFSALICGAIVSTKDALPSQIEHFITANKSICFYGVFAFCTIQFVDRLIENRKVKKRKKNLEMS